MVFAIAALLLILVIVVAAVQVDRERARRHRASAPVPTAVMEGGASHLRSPLLSDELTAALNTDMRAAGDDHGEV